MRVVLMKTVEDLKEEMALTKQSYDATINELKQQKKQLEDQLKAENIAEYSLLKAENRALKTDLEGLRTQVEELRATREENIENKHVQTNEIGDFSESKNAQFENTLMEFGWIEKLLIENIADSERIFNELSGKE